MPQFKFYQDCKQTIWYRCHFSVEADSYDDAVKQIEPYKNDDIYDDGPENFGRGSSGVLYDTIEPMYPNENDEQATLVVFDDEDKELFHNGKES